MKKIVFTTPEFVSLNRRRAGKIISGDRSAARENNSGKVKKSFDVPQIPEDSDFEAVRPAKNRRRFNRGLGGQRFGRKDGALFPAKFDLNGTIFRPIVKAFNITEDVCTRRAQYLQKLLA